MRRREFLTFLGGAAAAWPVAAVAQQRALPVIGLLHTGSAEAFADFLYAFLRGLGETGYVEGRNVGIEYRWANGQSERLPELAADLVRRRVNVIVTAGGNRPAQIAKSAMVPSELLPIVFMEANDPVRSGLVANLNRPGGNLTGVTTLTSDLVPKRLELLREAIPNVKRVAVLSNENEPSPALQAAALGFGLQLVVVRAGTERELEMAFAGLGQLATGGLIIPPDPFFFDRRALLGSLVLRHGIPAIHSYREFVAAGGLMSYGGSLTEGGRIMGNYTGRILKGEKPADLPVQQATRVELIINMKAAKALGLTFPLTLLGRADEVIE